MIEFVENINALIFTIELLIGAFLIARFKIINPITFVYIIVFVYGQSFYIDYLFLEGSSNIRWFYTIDLNINSLNYLKVNLSYFSFHIAILFGSILLMKNLVIPTKTKIIVTNKLLLNLFYLLMFILVSIKTYSELGTTRVDKMAAATIPSVLFNNFITYSWILISLSLRNKGKFYLLYTVAVIISFILSFEREPLVAIFLVLLIQNRKRISLLLISILSPLFFFILAYWKPFYNFFLYSDGGGMEALLRYNNSYRFSLAALEPGNSVVLFYDFFANPDIYANYQFSYLTNTYHQFVRMIFHSDYKSIAEYVSNYYVNDTYGLAFNMVLESFLNFSFLGPTFLGLALVFITFILNQRIKYDGIGIIAIWIFMLTKLVRTEFTTVIKLQIVPALLSYVVVILLICRIRWRQS